MESINNMAYNMPDGCTQADHDAYYDDGQRGGGDPDTVRFQCGHYGPEDSGSLANGQEVCASCGWADYLEQQERQPATGPHTAGCRTWQDRPCNCIWGDRQREQNRRDLLVDLGEPELMTDEDIDRYFEERKDYLR